MMKEQVMVYHLRFALSVRQLEDIAIDNEIWDVLRGHGELQVDNRELLEFDEEQEQWLKEKDNG